MIFVFTFFMFIFTFFFTRGNIFFFFETQKYICSFLFHFINFDLPEKIFAKKGWQKIETHYKILG